MKLYREKTKHIAQIDRLSVLDQSINKDISIFREKSILPDTRLSELLRVSDNIKRTSVKYNAEIIYFTENGSNNLEIKTGKNNITNNELEVIEPTGDIRKSSFFNFDFSIEWFESLRGIHKLAVCLILGKSVILSALISIIFIFYGNILIEKYDLVNKYPKLAKLIELRQKYQKYYFKFNCLLIFIIVITELLLGFALLLL
jgi:hypothetical protein